MAAPFPDFSAVEYKAVIDAVKALYDTEVAAGRQVAKTDQEFLDWPGSLAFVELVLQKYYTENALLP